MSVSRVKRSYDTLCSSGYGEEAMMTSSPACSPMRIQTLGEPASLALGAAVVAAPLQPLNFVQAAQQAPPAAASSSSSSEFRGFNFTSTFSSLSPAPTAAGSTSAAPQQLQQPAQPQYFSPAPTSKRVRKNGAADVSMMEEGGEGESDASGNGKHESPFHKLKRPHLDDLMFVPRSFKKQAMAAALSGPSSSAHATPVRAPAGVVIPGPASTTGAQLPNYHHQLFTYDQVSSIVRNALEMREEQVREEYNRTLQELLREQFENFSSFNRDYISRTMKTIDREEDQDNSYYS